MIFLRWITGRRRSFIYAGNGITAFIRSEPHARVHLAVTIGITCLSFYYRISKAEIIAIIFSVGLVWITEMINTAIEKTADFICTALHPQIKLIKDIAAGAVLVSALAAAITGCLIFLPKIF